MKICAQTKLPSPPPIKNQMSEILFFFVIFLQLFVLFMLVEKLTQDSSKPSNEVSQKINLGEIHF